ncbi:MAG: energy transducer TonB [Deltaproteobacteria bacterium]|nr:energy transducer TonB [Deltaproteobacteria bacterium]
MPSPDRRNTTHLKKLLPFIIISIVLHLMVIAYGSVSQKNNPVSGEGLAYEVVVISSVPAEHSSDRDKKEAVNMIDDAAALINKDAAADKNLNQDDPRISIEGKVLGIEEGYIAKLMEIVKANSYYPASAKKAGISGRVVTAFTVTMNGTIENLKINTSSGAGLLDTAALKIIKRSVPLPIPPNGRFDVKLPINFTLSES